MTCICSRGGIGSKCASYAKAFVKEREKPPPAPPKGGESEFEESPLVS